MSVLSYNYTFTSYLAFAPVVLRYVSEAIERSVLKLSTL